MFRKSSIAFCALVAGLIAGSCKLPFESRSVPGASDPDVPAAKTGRLLIAIPSVAPWLVPLVERASGAATADPRAYLYANKVVVNLYSGTEPVVPSITITPTETGPNGGLNLAAIEGIPVGTGYSLSVNIYNTNQYQTYSWLSGSATIDIAEGQETQARITCVPSPNWTYRVNEYIGDSWLTMNGEYWYRMNTTFGEVVSITQSKADFPTFLFGPEGKLIASITNASEAYTFTETAPGGSAYYLGTAALSTGMSGLSVKRTRPQGGEGTVAAPIRISPDDPERRFALSYRDEQSAASYYTFTTNSVDADYYFVSGTQYKKTFSLHSSADFSPASIIAPMDRESYTESTSELSWRLSPSTTYFLKIVNPGEYDIRTYDLPYNFQGRLIGETEAVRLGRSSAPRALTIGSPTKLQGNGHLYADDLFTFTTSNDPMTSYSLAFDLPNRSSSYYHIYYRDQNGKNTTIRLSPNYDLNDSKAIHLPCTPIGSEMRLAVYARSEQGKPMPIGDLGAVVLRSSKSTIIRQVSLGWQESRWDCPDRSMQWNLRVTPGRTYRIELLDRDSRGMDYKDLLLAAYDASGESYFDFVDIAAESSKEHPRKILIARDSALSLVFRVKEIYSSEFGAIVDELPSDQGYAVP